MPIDKFGVVFVQLGAFAHARRCLSAAASNSLVMFRTCVLCVRRWDGVQELQGVQPGSSAFKGQSMMQDAEVSSSSSSGSSSSSSSSRGSHSPPSPHGDHPPTEPPQKWLFSSQQLRLSLAQMDIYTTHLAAAEEVDEDFSGHFS